MEKRKHAKKSSSDVEIGPDPKKAHDLLSIETIAGAVLFIASLFIGIDLPLSFLQQPSAYSKGLMVGAAAAGMFLVGLWLLAKSQGTGKKLKP